MTSSAEKIRCTSDTDFYESLLNNRDIKRTNERLARMEASTPTSIRRRLLATSVRLSPRMVLDRIASGLSIPSSFVCQSIDEDYDPD